MGDDYIFGKLVNIRMMEQKTYRRHVELWIRCASGVCGMDRMRQLSIRERYYQKRNAMRKWNAG